MVVRADRAGLVELVWGKHWSETGGQAVTAVTSLFAIVAWLPVTRLRRFHETEPGGSTSCRRTRHLESRTPVTSRA